MANENCLEGVKCPKCEQEDVFKIVGVSTFTVLDDGTDVHGDVEWDDDSTCTCGGCSWVARLGDFRKGPDVTLHTLPEETQRRLRRHASHCSPEGFDMSHWEIYENETSVVVQCIRCMTVLVMLAKKLEGE